MTVRDLFERPSWRDPQPARFIVLQTGLVDPENPDPADEEWTVFKIERGARTRIGSFASREAAERQKHVAENR